jgi:WD40 repeat protein
VRTLTEPTQAVVGVAFSPDGGLVAGSGDDSVIRLWRASDGALVRTITGDMSHVYKIAFSPDGRWLVSGGRGQSAIATAWKQIAGYRFSPNGDTVRLWRVSDGAQQQVLTDHRDDVWSVAFSPDGGWIASSGEDNEVRLYRITVR